MSDTTTITPEDRALWFKDAQPKSVGHYEPIDFEMDKRIRRLLTALEAAEDEVRRLLAERDWLAGKLAELHDASLMLVDGAPDGSNRKPYWQEAARRAVAAGEG